MLFTGSESCKSPCLIVDKLLSNSRLGLERYSSAKVLLQIVGQLSNAASTSLLNYSPPLPHFLITNLINMVRYTNKANDDVIPIIHHYYYFTHFK